MPGAIPSPEYVATLAAVHVERYGLRLAAALRRTPGYRIDECAMYLALWLAIVLRGCRWEFLNERERSEVGDAIEERGGERP